MRRAVAFVAVFVALGVAFLYARERFAPREGLDEAGPVESLSPPAEPAPPSARSEPAPPAPSRPEAPEGEADAALPDLDASDAAMLRVVASLIGPEAVERFVADGDVVRKAVVTTDGLARDALPLRLRLVPAVEGRLATTRAGDEIHLSPENYARYEPFVRIVRGLDATRITDTYARFYPLLQEAWVELGHPGEQFNDRLIAVVDELLDTPQPEPPIRLVAPRVLDYTFADPALESLSSGQKILIRMGPANAAIVTRRLGEIRTELVERSHTLDAVRAADGPTSSER